MPENIMIQSRETLSHYKFPLQKITYATNEEEKPVSREAYFPPDSATVLLYNPQAETVLLTRQFRLAAFVNGHPTGQLLETCAGNIHEGEAPDASIIREIKEETGYAVKAVQKLFALYTTPGSVTEKLHYFAAAYTPADKVGSGGGLADEHENIETIESPFEQAYTMSLSGEIVDAKTVLLLQWAKNNLFR